MSEAARERKRRLRPLARWMRALPHHAESVAAFIGPEIWAELNRQVRAELVPLIAQRSIWDWFSRGVARFIDFVKRESARGLAVLKQSAPPPEEVFWEIVSSKIEEELVEWAITYWQSIFHPVKLAGHISAAIREGRGVEEAIWAGIAASGFRYHVIERGIRTAVVSSLNGAAHQVYIASGATHLKWVSTLDKRTRGMRPHDTADHVKMNGMVVPIGTPFRTPRGHLLRYPGDRGLGAPPSEWINCRCTLVPVVKEEE